MANRKKKKKCGKRITHTKIFRTVVVKTKLENLLVQTNKQKTLKIINGACKRTHQIYARTCELIKAYLSSIAYQNFITNGFSKLVNPTNTTHIQFPIIDKTFVEMSFKPIMKDSLKYDKSDNKENITISKRYNVKDDHNLRKLTEISNFYEQNKNNLGFNDKIDGNHLGQILCYASMSIVTSIENNIREHFIDNLRHYVNRMFSNEFVKITESSNTNTEKYQATKQLREELFKVKEDLIYYTLNSDNKYHDWIKNVRGKILPKQLDNIKKVDKKINYLYLDIIKNPQKYLSYMFNMSIDLEENEKGLMQVFPLRRSFILNYFALDTKSIIELLCETGVKHKLANLSDLKNDIWNEFFDLNNKLFKNKIKSYTFKNMIYTDGYAVSVIFEHNSFLGDTLKANQLKKDGRDKVREEQKDMTSEEKKQYKLLRVKKKEDNKNILRKKREEEKVKYNELSKDVKDKMAKDKKEKLEKKKKELLDTYEKMSNEDKKLYVEQVEYKKRETQVEFPYFEELTEKQLEELKERNFVYDDPGRVRLGTFYGKKETPTKNKCKHKLSKNINKEDCKRCKQQNNYKLLKYSNGQRIHETKLFIYRKKLDKLREDLGIINLELELNDFNGKSCIPTTFMRYVKKKTELSISLLKKYSNISFRKYKWYSFINRQRSEMKLVNKIKKTYGEDCVLVYGDWSVSKHLRNYMPTPMIGFKRMLRRFFDVINIDEYGTSKYSNKTKEECGNLTLETTPKKKYHKIKRKKDEANEKPCVTETVRRELHSVLTMKLENGRMGCMNRDFNAVSNMKEITEYWLKTRKRLPRFDRKKVK